MKTKNIFKKIRNIIVGNTQPNNDALWIDTSSGEKNAVLKYKGNPVVGSGSNGGSSTNPGYTVTKSYTTLEDETITTVVDGDFNGAGFPEAVDIIVGDTYKVTFNGTEYTCVAFDDDEATRLGAPFDYDNNGYDFSTYSFNITTYLAGRGGYVTIICTASAGEYSVKIEHLEESVETTEDFKAAVDSVTGYSIDTSNEILFDGTVETVDDEGNNVGIITPTITFVEGDTYKVTLNGTEYICKCLNDDDIIYVGASYIDDIGLDWSTYPFYIETFNTGGGVYETEVYTSEEGSYTLKIEHLTTSTKTTPAFESMIQGIAGSSTYGCQIIYPDSVSWIDWVYSQYNTAPEAGNIYFIPFIDNDSPYRGYLYPVHIDELTNNNNVFSGFATIIGNPIIMDNGALTAQPFDGTINPEDPKKGLCIRYYQPNNYYTLSYDSGPVS